MVALAAGAAAGAVGAARSGAASSARATVDAGTSEQKVTIRSGIPDERMRHYRMTPPILASPITSAGFESEEASTISGTWGRSTRPGAVPACEGGVKKCELVLCLFVLFWL